MPEISEMLEVTENTEVCTETCNVCFHHCRLSEGTLGACRGRRMVDGKIIPENYGRLTSIALDPIEKKPLRRFKPGSMILSVGSYGCNLSCRFCQNYHIAAAGPDDGTGRWHSVRTQYVSPDELTSLALSEKRRGNIGVAFTYNEPLISWEYIRDSGRLLHDEGMPVVVVTNGTASQEVFSEIAPYVDAMNIDLKSFNPDYYKKICGGDLDMVKDFITAAAASCHVELTTLIVPGENDSDDEMREIATWIASLPNGREIPLHVSRFFPMHLMTEKNPTPVGTVYRLAGIAREYLKYVYTGNC